MDSKRYQQIQDLFWQTEALPAAQREAFLQEQAGDDRKLVDEVLSLLREHDPDAASIEGRTVQPIKLPGSAKYRVTREAATSHDTLAGEQLNIRETTSMRSHRSSKAGTTTKKGVPGQQARDTGERTIGGAERTHAAPRHPHVARHQRSTDVVSGKLPTSIGPPRLRWAWVPLWAAMALMLLVPIWIVAWTIGRHQMSREQVTRERLLPLALDQARLQIETLLDADLRTCEKLAHELNGDLASDAAVEPTHRFATVIWDADFRIRSAAAPLELSNEFWTSRYAGQVARCLEGQVVFCGPAAPSLASGSEPARVQAHVATENLGIGWIVPLSNPNGAYLSTSQTLWMDVDTAIAELAETVQLDVYLVDRQGTMQTTSGVAQAWLDQSGQAQRIGGSLRVAEYDADARQVRQSIAPLTIAAAAVSVSRGVVLGDEIYPSYHGGDCQGAWQWLPRYDLGLIVETPVQRSADPFSRIWTWAGLASLLAMSVASAATFWHQRQINLLTVARQPLGRYEISRELGSGGMGVVYLAKHKELGRDIALKVLRGDRQDEDDRQRFDREARLAASLSCPHTVSVYDFGYTEHGNAYCVMELLAGMTLAELVARDGAQQPGRVVWIMQQICQSMLEAHRKGLMHRDLKPQNVMLRFDTVVGDWATVFDFGLAKPIEPSQDVFQTSETIWAGTPMYMAPERFRDPTSMDPRSDIYSIGCIAYYLLAGNPPFVECDPESMFALIMSEHPINIATHRGEEIEPRLDNWVRDCMRKDKNTRSDNIPDLVRSLQAMSESMPWGRSDAETWWAAHAGESIR